MAGEMSDTCQGYSLTLTDPADMYSKWLADECPWFIQPPTLTERQRTEFRESWMKLHMGPREEMGVCS